MKTRYPVLRAAACLAAALCAGIALAACTDDANEPHNAGQRTPLIFTATVAAPTTAVATPTTRANTAASQWTDGDEVAVEMNGVVKKYIIKTDAGAGATASLRPADAENTHYVPNGSFTVRAWRYGHTMPFTENFDWNRKPDKWYTIPAQDATSDGESHYQQSDFLYAPELTVGNSAVSGSSIGLRFYHQTARVVVNIREAGAVKAENKERIEVTLGAPVDATPESPCNLSTRGTFNARLIDHYRGKYSGLEADVTAETGFVRAKPIVPANEGYACSFEALVIPQNMSGQKFIQVSIPGPNPDTTNPETGSYYYTPKDGEADLLGGYTYTYDIIVSKDGTLDVTVATPIAGWEDKGEGGSGTVVPLIQIDLDNPPTINDDGVYLLTGTKTGMVLNITGGNPTVIVRDLEIFNGCIHITGGTPEIKVEGRNNEIDNYQYAPPIWLDGAAANVRITGKSINESRLRLGTINTYPDAVIGTKGSGTGWENLQCGNIEISNLTLHAGAAMLPYDFGGAAAIGTGGGWGDRKCGNIFISDAHINANPDDGAATIGFGSANSSDDMTGITYEMGNITIKGATTIESTIGKGANGIYPAHIGSGSVMAGKYNIGYITINTDKSGPEFFGKFDGGTKSDDEMIVGFPGNVKSWRTLWNNPDGLFIAGINWSMVR